ncbi:hypothetical protein MRB53_030484 [Persea americana]|uniref:Uncharacterized protein n=1 Tax=Persea americana TaxID=3435 RepID=A0ACC2KLT8_PERAE|nr:hypothetical protein MRB53_030484 [Persea americana]
MALVLGSGHSDIPNSNQLQGNGKSIVGRKSANYHPPIWGDRFLKSSLDDLKPDALTQKRADELKEEVKRMLITVNDHLHELNLIDAIQRLGVAYHFEKEIAHALIRIHNTCSDKEDDSDDLHTMSLRFRLLRQEGYNASPNVFNKFKDGEGSFKKSLVHIRGLLSLYEATYMGIRGEDVLDEARGFTTEHLKLALPHLNSPLSTLVELALELPLRKRVERLQSRYYISIYQQEKEQDDTLLEFAKLDFNLLQLLHQRELMEISIATACEPLPVTKHRPPAFSPSATAPASQPEPLSSLPMQALLSANYKKHHSQSKLLLKTAIRVFAFAGKYRGSYSNGLKSYVCPFYCSYSVYQDELLWGAAWLHKATKNPAYLNYIQVKGQTLGVDETDNTFGWDNQHFKEVSKHFFIEMEWLNSGYSPTLEEYTSVALITGAYFAYLEQMRGHVASCIQIYMKKHGCTYEEACEKFNRLAADAWKDINKECLKPTEVPMPLLMRAVNFARVIEVLYQHRDGYTNSTFETKDRISLVLVDPVPV